MDETTSSMCLIDGCIAQDRHAQHLFFTKYSSYAKSICSRYTFCIEDTEDVLSESFTKIFNNLSSYRPDCSILAWLRTIIVNTAISYNRKYKKHSLARDSFDDQAQIHLDGPDILSILTVDEILQVVSGLKPAERDIFLLYNVDGYNHREISVLLKMNEGSVRSVYARTKIKLKQQVILAFPVLK